MATFYSEYANASWLGDFFPRGSSQNSPTFQTFEMTVTAAQAVANNIFNVVKLDRNTIIIDGYAYASGLDVHSSTTATVDFGFLSDADGDGDTDVIDFFADDLALPTLTGAIQQAFHFNDGAATDFGQGGPFIPVDTLTSDSDTINGGYFVSAKLLGTVATAGVGIIRVGLLLANKTILTGASGLLTA